MMEEVASLLALVVCSALLGGVLSHRWWQRRWDVTWEGANQHLKRVNDLLQKSEALLQRARVKDDTP